MLIYNGIFCEIYLKFISQHTPNGGSDHRTSGRRATRFPFPRPGNFGIPPARKAHRVRGPDGIGTARSTRRDHGEHADRARPERIGPRPLAALVAVNRPRRVLVEQDDWRRRHAPRPGPARLRAAVEAHPDAMLVAHSLGRAAGHAAGGRAARPAHRRRPAGGRRPTWRAPGSEPDRLRGFAPMSLAPSCPSRRRWSRAGPTAPWSSAGRRRSRPPGAPS